MKATKKNAKKAKAKAHTKTKEVIKDSSNMAEALAIPVIPNALRVGNSKIDQVMRRIREKLEALDSGELEAARTNYDIGEDVKEVAAKPEEFGIEPGTSVVKQIADQFGFRKDTIYNGLKVANAWPRKDFTGWVTKKGKDGWRLSFAHFVEVMKLEDHSARESMLDRALNESLSTRALRALCRKPKGERRVSGSSLLKSTIKLTGRSLEAFKDLAVQLRALDVGEIADAAGLLESLANLQYELSSRCLENAAAARELAGCAGSAPVPLDASTPAPGLKLLAASAGA